MELKFAKIISYISLIIGSLMIIGTVFKWKLLVDPPEEWSGLYSHSAIKKWFGNEFLIVYNYIVGTLLILFALFVLRKIFTGTIEFE